ncbi:MAG: DUF4838 domain-containing protein [Planctomycetota bacterium]
MKHALPGWILVATLLLLSVPTGAGELVLAEGGKSPYRIVVSAGASPPVRHAAEELQTFLREIAGVELSIVTDREPPGPAEILVGDSTRLPALDPAIDLAALGREGYVLRAVGPHLVIAGGEPRGTLYGVYGLLEDHLGCRWFTPAVSRIPEHSRLALPALDETVVPALEYREPFTFECFDGDWCARNRMNSSSGRLGEHHGGKIQFADGFFCHTFATLVPPATYFAPHPEYFSLVGGQRQNGYAQLCCTNEDVIRPCTEGIRTAMREHPEAFVFSVSQNDTFQQCECKRCQALATAEDSQMAPVLALVNRVAEAVAEEFPDQVVETLAYQWTRRPPKTMRLRPNVVIRLCSIECCFAHPLESCDSPANRAFCADLAGWARICDRLWIWDYVTDFSHYLLPFPNQRVRDDNIRLFVRNHARGIFEQDTYDTPASELAGLGGWLTAKYLWNPAYDEETAIAEFLSAVYGPAAAPIGRYLDLLHDHAAKENVHVAIWAAPASPHLPDELLLAADRLWREAEELAAGDEAVLGRVRIARLSVDYAIAERVRAAGPPPDAPRTPLAALAVERYRPYVETLAASGITRLHEGRPLDVAAYRAGLAAALGVDP